MPGVDLNYFMRQASKLTEKLEQRPRGVVPSPGRPRSRLRQAFPGGTSAGARVHGQRLRAG